MAESGPNRTFGLLGQVTPRAYCRPRVSTGLERVHLGDICQQ